MGCKGGGSAIHRRLVFFVEMEHLHEHVAVLHDLQVQIVRLVGPLRNMRAYPAVESPAARRARHSREETDKAGRLGEARTWREPSALQLTASAPRVRGAVFGWR